MFETRLRATSLSFGFVQLTTGKHCQPSSKWIHFTNHENIRQRKEKNELLLSYVIPKMMQWPSIPTDPTVTTLSEFNFYSLKSTEKMHSVIHALRCILNEL